MTKPLDWHARLRSVVIIGLALACAGRSAPPEPAHPASPASRHGYALLFELVSQQKDVSKLLIIKSERSEFGDLIRDIAETCGSAHERLTELAEADPSLDLKDTGLPTAELETRAAIKKVRTAELLSASGKEFELQLMLSQNEALSYLTNLTEVLARAEPDPARVEFLRALWKDMHALHARVTNLFRARYRWTPPEG